MASWLQVLLLAKSKKIECPKLRQSRDSFFERACSEQPQFSQSGPIINLAR
jgi:hypothetical protein